jgi:23S rRNA (guanosine2251-2'-O)-methyltransferase
MTEDLIYGRWPVLEALRAGQVGKLFVARGTRGENIEDILTLARDKGIPFHMMDRFQLERMLEGNDVVHQGVVAQVAPMAFVELDEIVRRAAAHQGRGPAALLLDGITDPHNVGSLLRSSVFFGVPGVVIPKWRAAGITQTVVRASAGAARLIPISQVSNLANAVEAFKKAGVWMIGADMDGADIKKADLPRPFALVMGSEGEGLHQLIKKRCDVVVSIAKTGGAGVDSLNVGVAAGILIHQFA